MRSPNDAIVRAISRDRRIIDRFWSNVDRGTSTADCWEWRGPRGFGAYPVFRVKYSSVSAARLAWFAATGELPLGGRLRRTCENAYCVRPEHMDWEVGARTEQLLRATADACAYAAAVGARPRVTEADVPYRRAS